MFEIVFYVIGLLVISFFFVVFFGSPYVPTLKNDVARVVEIYSFTKKDVVVDVGSGGGTVLRAVAASGARTIGYEISPWLYVVSKILCRRFANIQIRLVNFWRVGLPPETTVVYTFLNGRHIEKLLKRLELHVSKTGKPLYFISYGFALKNVKPLDRRGAVYLYKFTPLQT